MLDTEIIELIHKDIDGELDDGGKSRLLEYLRENDEANSLYSNLYALAKNLDQQSQIAPPSDLKQNIISKINPDLYQNSLQKKTKVFRLGDVFTEQKIRQFLAYAAVLIIGFSISVLLLKSSPTSQQNDFQKILGTIGMEDVDRVNSVHVDFDELKGRVNLKEADSIVWLEFDLNSNNKFNTEITYEPEHLVFELFRPFNPDILHLKHAKNNLNITTAQPFILSFAKKTDAASHLKFSIRSNSQTSEDFELSTSKSPIQ